MSKRFTTIILMIVFVLTLVGCGSEKVVQGDRTVNVDVGSSDYVLTAKNGSMILFDINGKELHKIDLKSNKKSDFIYTVDSGNVYAKSLINKDDFVNIIYALDKNKGKLFIVKVEKDKFTKVAEKSLRESDEITSISAYNGSFFYSVKDKSKWAEKYTFIRPEDERLNGVIDYYASTTVDKNRALNTYVFVEDYSDIYFKETDFKKDLTDFELASIVTPMKKRAVYELPADVESWSSNARYIYFFFEGKMGLYDMAKNQVGVYYNAFNTIDSEYVDGRFKNVLTLGDLGENSRKTLLFSLNPKNSVVNNILTFEEESPLAFSSDSNEYIHMIFKTDGQETFSKLKTVNYKSGKTVSSAHLKYVPTDVQSHNGHVYMINPLEEYFLVGLAGSNDFSKYSTVYDGINYSGLLLIDLDRKDFYLYDDNGRFVDEEGRLITADNQLVDINNNLINKYGQAIDSLGRAININGQLIDRYNNVIDENYKILHYTKQENGQFLNSKGQVVDINGELLVQNEEGNWYNPNSKVPEPIRGHYDENGNFVIDADYLEKYPDAYERLNETQN